MQLLQVTICLLMFSFALGEVVDMMSTCQDPHNDCEEIIISKGCDCTEMASLLRYAIHSLQCVGGVVVDNICYKLPYVVGRSITYSEASDLCLFHGGKLAEVKTKEVYDAIFDYVKATWNYDVEHPDWDRIGVWIGMTYQNGYSVALNGDTGYLKWKPGYPLSDPDRTKISITVPISPKCSTDLYHMWNGPPSTISVPICQLWDE